MTARDAEVVVVGAGVMGLATARELARAGRPTILLEQFRLGHDKGSSHGGSRIFRLSYPGADWVRETMEALPLWRELEAEAGEPLLELHGSVDVGDWGANRDALAEAGAPFEILGRAEAARRFGLALEPGEEALFQPQGGVAYADRTLAALEGSARGHGAEIREETRVVALHEEGDAVRVELEDGELRARTVVVTAGSWIGRLVDLVDAHPTRETTAYFAHDEPIPSLIDSTLDGVNGYALVAPGLGVKAGVHKSGPRVNADDPGEPDPAIAQAAAEWLVRRFPRLDPEPAKIERCLYTNLTGDRFTLERRGRVVVGSPCSGHGFKFAPLIGRRLAALTERDPAPRG